MTTPERAARGPDAQQRLEWVAAALHGDPLFGPASLDLLVRQVEALRAASRGPVAPPSEEAVKKVCLQRGDWSEAGKDAVRNWLTIAYAVDFPSGGPPDGAAELEAHRYRQTRFFQPGLGPCRCRYCEKLPWHGVTPAKDQP